MEQRIDEFPPTGGREGFMSVREEVPSELSIIVDQKARPGSVLSSSSAISSSSSSKIKTLFETTEFS
jgi:hypothetical protein